MKEIIEKLASKQNQAPEDYTGADGLLYCGKCHTPKQSRVMGITTPVPITCQCRELEISKEADAQKKKRVEELRARCLPVEAMHKRTFSVAGDEKHIQNARMYVHKWEQISEENIGLILWGNTGTGKTFTAQCIANALIDQEVAVMYISAAELVALLMDREKRGQIMADVRRVPLLIIDDVGAERDTPFSREQLCAVIDARSEAQKPLIVTTNTTQEEMKKCADPTLRRLYDRLLSCCGAPMAVIGESKRGGIAAQKLQRARELLGM